MDPTLICLANESQKPMFRKLRNLFWKIKESLSFHLAWLFSVERRGEIINALQKIGFTYDGIVLNAGAYTHTSIAIHDAIAAIKTPWWKYTFPIFMPWRISAQESNHLKMRGLITGFGLEGYAMAIHYLLTRK